MSKCFIICGATASGKSSLALEMAQLLEGNIINFDSKQLLKEFPTLTDRPTEAECELAPHFLYGYKSIFDRQSLYSWAVDAAKVVMDSLHEGRIPILVGGTGFYIHNLLNGFHDIPNYEGNVDFLSQDEKYNLIKQYDKENTLHKNDSYRIARQAKILLTTGKSMRWWQNQEKVKLLSGVKFIKILLDPPKEVVAEKCRNRIEKMFPAVLDEVAKFESADESVIGVRQVRAYLNNELDLESTKEAIQQETLQYAKRQRTWFRNKMQFDCVVARKEELGSLSV